MPACRYVEVVGSAAMLATKRSAGFTPDMNIREHVTHLPPTSTNKAAHSDFEMLQNRGISGSIKKGLVSSKFFLKNTQTITKHHTSTTEAAVKNIYMRTRHERTTFKLSSVTIFLPVDVKQWERVQYINNNETF